MSRGKQDRGVGKTYKVLELSACLLDDTVLPTEDYTHAAEVAYLGTAHDERVDVESAPGEDS